MSSGGPCGKIGYLCVHVFKNRDLSVPFFDSHRSFPSATLPGGGDARMVITDGRKGPPHRRTIRLMPTVIRYSRPAGHRFQRFRRHEERGIGSKISGQSPLATTVEPGSSGRHGAMIGHRAPPCTAVQRMFLNSITEILFSSTRSHPSAPEFYSVIALPSQTIHRRPLGAVFFCSSLIGRMEHLHAARLHANKA
jgi:hypothetical protein